MIGYASLTVHTNVASKHFLIIVKHKRPQLQQLGSLEFPEKNTFFSASTWEMIFLSVYLCKRILVIVFLWILSSGILFDWLIDFIAGLDTDGHVT